MAIYTKPCNKNHDICSYNVIYFKKNMVNLNKDSFLKFIDVISMNIHYNNCLSHTHNKKYKDILDFIVLASGLFEISFQKIMALFQNIFNDDELKRIVENQIKINTIFKQDLLTKSISDAYYSNKILFLPNCISFKRINTFKYVLNILNIDEFVNFLIQSKNTLINDSFETEIGEYISKNNKLFTTNTIIKMIDALLEKPLIINLILKNTIYNLNKEDKVNILNKIACSASATSSNILLILESNDVIPNETTITNLISKVVYRKLYGAYNAKLIAEIIDIFVLYGLKITKKIVIELLKKGCYINSIELHSVPIDDDILEICSEISYYPYDFNGIPPHKVMLKECEKTNNLEQIKKFKEKGGVLDVKCLEKACSIVGNGKTIKYIISDCGVKPNYNCVSKFEATYHSDALSLLISNYSDKVEEKKISNNIVLDEKTVLSIEKADLVFDKNIEYNLKIKIKKFFKYTKKTINYTDLYELMLKYLIQNKLVIGNYFIINDDLEKLIKINKSTILNIDQIDNIMSYFIEIDK